MQDPQLLVEIPLEKTFSDSARKASALKRSAKAQAYLDAKHGEKGSDPSPGQRSSKSYHDMGKKQRAMGTTEQRRKAALDKVSREVRKKLSSEYEGQLKQLSEASSEAYRRAKAAERDGDPKAKDLLESAKSAYRRVLKLRGEISSRVKDHPEVKSFMRGVDAYIRRSRGE